MCRDHPRSGPHGRVLLKAHVSVTERNAAQSHRRHDLPGAVRVPERAAYRAQLDAVDRHRASRIADQYAATDFVVPGAGTLSMTFTPAGGGQPIIRKVYEFPAGGGALAT